MRCCRNPYIIHQGAHSAQTVEESRTFILTNKTQYPEHCVNGRKRQAYKRRQMDVNLNNGILCKRKRRYRDPHTGAIIRARQAKNLPPSEVRVHRSNPPFLICSNADTASANLHVANGHCGVNKLSRLLSANYHCKNANVLTQICVQRCAVCRATRQNNRRRREFAAVNALPMRIRDIVIQLLAL